MKKNLILRVSVALLLTLVLVSGAVLSVVYARYVSRTNSLPTLVTAEDFYFECNFEHGGLYLFPTGKDFVFKVKNYDALGNVTTPDTDYTVTLDAAPLHTDAPRLTGGVESERIFTIDHTLLTVGQKYTVEITSSAPYEKTISYQIFVVADTVENFYTLKDCGNWVQLDLYIGTTPPSELTVQYGADLSPDNTHPLMRAWESSDENKTLTDFDLHPYTHYTLIFFGARNVTNVTEKTPLTDTIILE